VRTNPKAKPRYRLRNWREYNAALVRRGSLTLWCDRATLAGWVARGDPDAPRRRGRPRTYSDLAITCMLTLQAVYHLPLRAAEGLMRSVVALLGVALPVADFSTLSRRRATLAVRLPVRVPPGPLHVVVDSTGLKVFGEGEWKVRRYGWTTRRTWLKVHLLVDEATSELRGVGASTAAVGDGQLLPALLAAERAPLRQVTGDGSYDAWRCWDAVAARPEAPRAVFPPRGRTGYRRARITQHGNCAAPPLARDQHIRAIRRHGRRAWQAAVGYHRRSLSETAVYRFKTIFGPTVSARTFPGQAHEVFIRAAALNRMTALGMPDSYKVA
jgi:hypothetical protein